jgi:hypothetical protein
MTWYLKNSRICNILYVFSKVFLTSCCSHVPNNAVSREHSRCLPISAHREYHAIIAPDGLNRVVCILRKKDGVFHKTTFLEFGRNSPTVISHIDGRVPNR